MKPVVLLAVLAFLQQPTGPPPSLPGQPCTGAALVGTWQFVERTRGPRPDLDGLTAYKHVTPSHFVVTRVNGTGVVDSAHGGSHAFAGGTYTETLEFFSTHERYAKVQRGVKVAFQCAMDGDDWRIAGEFNGVMMEERWRRVAAGSGM